ncbi:hypothetical protein ACFPT0_10550 [Acinetobacter portensis]|nr:hypothetical protein [Acinetobacter portensis]
MGFDFEKVMAQTEVAFDEIIHLSDQRLEKYKGKSFIENTPCIWEWRRY